LYGIFVIGYQFVNNDVNDYAVKVVVLTSSMETLRNTASRIVPTATAFETVVRSHSTVAAINPFDRASDTGKV